MATTESLHDYQYFSDVLPSKGVQKCGSHHTDATLEGWSGPVRDNNLYVKYFDPSLDENGLADLLKECGGVMSAKILRDRTGASKQAGFVQMSSKEGAQAAVSYLTGREVGGRKPLHVAAALSRTERQQQWLEKRHSRCALLHQSTSRREVQKWWKEGVSSEDSRGSSREDAFSGKSWQPKAGGVGHDKRWRSKASSVPLYVQGAPHPGPCSWHAPAPSPATGDSPPYAVYYWPLPQETPWGPGVPCGPSSSARGPFLVPSHPPAGVSLHFPVCTGPVPVPIGDGQTQPNGVTNMMVPRNPVTNHVPSNGCMMVATGGPCPYPPCGPFHFAAPPMSPPFASQRPA